MPHGIQLVTAPTEEPVTLARFKEHVGIPSSDNNNNQELRQCLIAAREFVENYRDRQFVAGTWREAFDRFPWEFRPLKNPLQSVTSITYTDTAGDSQTVAAATYVVDTYAEPGRIALASAQSWPTPLAEINTVLLTYVAGYTVVPNAAKQAILLLGANLFDSPEPVLKGSISTEIPFSVQSLLDQLDTGTW